MEGCSKHDLLNFLYALSESQGADPTRATDVGEDPERNGEPHGELGLVTPYDGDYWHEQIGLPSDPPGFLMFQRRDVYYSAEYEDGTTLPFTDLENSLFDGRHVADLVFPYEGTHLNLGALVLDIGGAGHDLELSVVGGIEAIVDTTGLNLAIGELLVDLDLGLANPDDEPGSDPILPVTITVNDVLRTYFENEDYFTGVASAILYSLATGTPLDLPDELPPILDHPNLIDDPIIEPILEPVVESIADALDPLFDPLAGAVEDTVDTISAPLSDISNALEPAGDAVTTTVDAVVATTAPVVTSMVQPVTDAVATLLTPTAPTASTSTTATTSPATTATAITATTVPAVTSVLQPVTGAVQTLLTPTAPTASTSTTATTAAPATTATTAPATTAPAATTSPATTAPTTTTNVVTTTATAVTTTTTTVVRTTTTLVKRLF